MCVVKLPDAAEPTSEVELRGNKTNEQTNEQNIGDVTTLSHSYLHVC